MADSLNGEGSPGHSEPATTPISLDPPIRIAAALIERRDGAVLLVRKRGTTAFMQPGGKLEPGENAERALCREVHEELGIEVPLSSLERIGRFPAPAANEPGRTVLADCFRAPLIGQPRAAAEIEELRWVNPTAPGDAELAPLTGEVLFPLLVRRRTREGRRGRVHRFGLAALFLAIVAAGALVSGEATRNGTLGGAQPTLAPTLPGFTPTPAPSASASAEPAPSGESVPIGDSGVWRQVFWDDFTKAAALGSFASASDPDKIVYTGAQGQQWLAYPETYTDTYQHRPYRSGDVLSVHDGVLDYWLHPVDGQPAGANPSPILASGSQSQRYGRYSARLKVDSSDPLSEYHIAWLLWPESERWPQDGEFDWPEAQLDAVPAAHQHFAGAASCDNDSCVDSELAPPGTSFNDWHTYTIEWWPGHIRFLVDNSVVLASAKAVASVPMRWQLQTETDGDGSHSGHLLVDWVAVWSYSP